MGNLTEIDALDPKNQDFAEQFRKTVAELYPDLLNDSRKPDAQKHYSSVQDFIYRLITRSRESIHGVIEGEAGIDYTKKPEAAKALSLNLARSILEWKESNNLQKIKLVAWGCGKGINELEACKLVPESFSASGYDLMASHVNQAKNNLNRRVDKGEDFLRGKVEFLEGDMTNYELLLKVYSNLNVQGYAQDEVVLSFVETLVHFNPIDALKVIYLHIKAFQDAYGSDSMPGLILITDTGINPGLSQNLFKKIDDLIFKRFATCIKPPKLYERFLEKFFGYEVESIDYTKSPIFGTGVEGKGHITRVVKSALDLPVKLAVGMNLSEIADAWDKMFYLGIKARRRKKKED